MDQLNNSTSQKIDFAHFLPIDWPLLENKQTIVSANAACFGRNLRKMFSPRLSSKCTSGSEYLIASRATQKLLENLSMVFIFS